MAAADAAVEHGGADALTKKIARDLQFSRNLQRQELEQKDEEIAMHLQRQEFAHYFAAQDDSENNVEHGGDNDDWVATLLTQAASFARWIQIAIKYTFNACILGCACILRCVCYVCACILPWMCWCFLLMFIMCTVQYLGTLCTNIIIACILLTLAFLGAASVSYYDLDDLLQRLPTERFHATRAIESTDENGQCCICRRRFQEDDEVRRLPCLHIFHCNEIDQWLRYKEECPICRTKVTEHLCLIDHCFGGVHKACLQKSWISKGFHVTLKRARRILKHILCDVLGATWLSIAFCWVSGEIWRFRSAMEIAHLEVSVGV